MVVLARLDAGVRTSADRLRNYRSDTQARPRDWHYLKAVAASWTETAIDASYRFYYFYRFYIIYYNA